MSGLCLSRASQKPRPVERRREGLETVHCAEALLIFVFPAALRGGRGAHLEVERDASPVGEDEERAQHQFVVADGQRVSQCRMVWPDLMRRNHHGRRRLCVFLPMLPFPLPSLVPTAFILVIRAASLDFLYQGPNVSGDEVAVNRQDNRGLLLERERYALVGQAASGKHKGFALRGDAGTVSSRFNFREAFELFLGGSAPVRACSKQRQRSDRDFGFESDAPHGPRRPDERVGECEVKDEGV
mmetsp:Transcript_26491/g.63962  ORF Transcript_26491/g.63962 Transcript_26491/m.63962 type:complete len:242 (-) Transcript_26491:316-1041(-)